MFITSELYDTIPIRRYPIESCDINCTALIVSTMAIATYYTGDMAIKLLDVLDSLKS